MNFGLTESQQILKNNAKKFFAAECPITEVRRIMETEHGHDDVLWKKMAEQGFQGVVVPEEYGGLGLGTVEMAALLEEMGRALVPGPFLSTLLAGSALAQTADHDAKEKYLGAVCRGESTATLAFLEATPSWEIASVSMPAAVSGSACTLNGEKMFVPDAAVAKFILVAARSGQELVLALVDAGAAGMTITAQPWMDMTRKVYKVAFANTPARVLATGSAAHSALDRAIHTANVGLCAEMVGGMQRAMEQTVEYAKTRKQFGKPIGTFQAVQHHCADLFFMTESARSTTMYAAWALQEGAPDAAVAVSTAKGYASDSYRECGNKAIQVHGGNGFTWENDMHLFYRRAKSSEVTFGDANYHREKIAKMVVDKRGD
jgi:alkylation response protein AidB-like acyl-CoA dehydrogenase